MKKEVKKDCKKKKNDNKLKRYQHVYFIYYAETALNGFEKTQVS